MPLNHQAHQEAEHMSESIWSAGFLWRNMRDAKLQFDIKRPSCQQLKASGPNQTTHLSKMAIFHGNIKTIILFLKKGTGHFWLNNCQYSADEC